MADGRHRPDVSENKRETRAIEKRFARVNMTSFVSGKHGWGGLSENFVLLFTIQKYFTQLFFSFFLFFVCVCLFWYENGCISQFILSIQKKKIEEEKKNRFFPDYSVVCIISVFLFIFPPPRKWSTNTICLSWIFFLEEKKWKLKATFPHNGGRSRDTLTEGKLRFHFPCRPFYHLKTKQLSSKKNKNWLCVKWRRARKKTL
jgi:hypothetical protein